MIPSNPSLPEITVEELQVMLRQSEPPLLLGVREPKEWAFNRIAGAKHIPMNEIPSRLDELPRDRPIVCYCHKGGRSARVQQYLAQQGFTNVINLKGGIDAWSREVDPAVPTY